MKALARSYVYWPNIDKDIMQVVKECSSCTTAAPGPIKVPLSSWPVSLKPWSRIHLDYAGPFQNSMFLIVVDSYSKWPATIAVLREVFARFGFPDIIVSDNGTQFSSGNIKEFWDSGGIQHIRTAPFHPQSNGQAEKFVDTFKRTMKKLEGEEITSIALQNFLESYRSTPNAQLPNNITPAEVMLGRKMKIQLDLLKPSSFEAVQRNDKMENQFNLKHGVKRKQFQPNELVFVKNYNRTQGPWLPGVILTRIGTVMYAVQVGNKTWRRHLNQLKPRYSVNQKSNSNFLLNSQETVSQQNPFQGDDRSTIRPTTRQKSAKQDHRASSNSSPNQHLHEENQQSQPVRNEPQRPVRNRVPPKRFGYEDHT